MMDRTHEVGISELYLFIPVLCCQGVICQFVRHVAMNRSIYNHAECFMRRFKLKISASQIWYLSKQSCDALNRLECHCLDAYRVFYGKSSNYWSIPQIL